MLFNNLYIQSGFKKDDSTINQLLYICHEILLSFDSYPPSEVRAVFLDISKAFDKDWHKVFVYKMKCNGIQGESLSLLSLDGRYQRTLLIGNTSEWAPVEAGVPQGSVRGPYCF